MEKKPWQSKTVLTCVATVGYAIAGMYLGKLDFNAGMQLIFAASAAFGFRDAMN